ncbi:MAG: ATP-sensitive inward rectifier potassium channel 10 [Myxococcales bacterium]|nr:ATP-sensitive inward rectifier potassium channel 10 [Myxococcales bacterium]MCB9701738.1 ATP-sensitive inward rectifier potassium channel 10 [Myxococcales bacterium]
MASVRSGKVVVTRRGVRSARLRDLYHHLMTLSWPAFLGSIAAAYLVVNLFFALLYLAGGDAIAEARPGSLRDAFFFSVQTMATIGYGRMYPQTLYGDLLVTLEAILGMISVAVAAGLCFARFARPLARVLFSRVAVISARDGVETLMVRVANERTNHIVEASVRAVLSRVERTREGKRIRRIHDLRLERETNPLFALTWTIAHPIDDRSPLFGETRDTLRASDAIILISLVGLDESLAQTVHAHHAYDAGDLVWGMRFADILKVHREGEVGEVDLGRFHDVVPVDRAGHDTGAPQDVWV